MNPTLTPQAKRWLIWGSGPAVLAVLVLLAWGRMASNATEARRSAQDLVEVRRLADQVARVRRPQSAPAAGTEQRGVLGQVESVAQAAGIAVGQLAELTRSRGGGVGRGVSGGDPGGPQVDLRGVSLEQVVVFLETWASSGPSRGAQSINFLPEGDPYGDQWTATLWLAE